MEDVRQRLGGMGLSGVTMEQLSDVEWKLGELKVRVCDRRQRSGVVLSYTSRYCRRFIETKSGRLRAPHPRLSLFLANDFVVVLLSCTGSCR